MEGVLTAWLRTHTLLFLRHQQSLSLSQRRRGRHVDISNGRDFGCEAWFTLNASREVRCAASYVGCLASLYVLTSIDGAPISWYTSLVVPMPRVVGHHDYVDTSMGSTSTQPSSPHVT